jgi:hypothetical protein
MVGLVGDEMGQKPLSKHLTGFGTIKAFGLSSDTIPE